MKDLRVILVVAAVAVVAMLTAPAPAVAGEPIAATLRGFEEPPSISTTGRGFFRGTISEDGTSIEYELIYFGLEGDVRQAHIHLGQRGVNGGISIWLCQTEFNPDPTSLSPTCPQEGIVTGVVTADNVIGPAGQGIAAGEFAEVLRAIRSGVTYANVHSTKHPGGEIRGQISAH